MKLLLALTVLVAAYLYAMLHTTDMVLGQTDKLNATYQNIANTDPEVLATGRAMQDR